MNSSHFSFPHYLFNFFHLNFFLSIFKKVSIQLCKYITNSCIHASKRHAFNSSRQTVLYLCWEWARPVQVRGRVWRLNGIIIAALEYFMLFLHWLILSSTNIKYLSLNTYPYRAFAKQSPNQILSTQLLIYEIILIMF